MISPPPVAKPSITATIGFPTRSIWSMLVSMRFS